MTGVVPTSHSEHGHAAGAAVVNDHEWSAASAFPASSLTPAEPPLTVAVYVVSYASAPLGDEGRGRAAGRDSRRHERPAGSRSSKLPGVTLAWAIASLKCAVTVRCARHPVAPAAGATLVTVGGVVSGTPVVNDQT